MEPGQASLFENDFSENAASTAGLDEAGRGCLAGPVVAAAVILPSGIIIQGLDDSKKLSPRQRTCLATRIKKVALAWSVGIVWPARIDEINILNASLEAMCKAAAHLAISPRLLLIDGNQPIRSHILEYCWPTNIPVPRQKTIVRGDSLNPAISAASIMAKTFRDNLMQNLARKWPGYGFEKHMGYGTREHRQKLAELGPCGLHRLTFKSVSTLHAKM